MKEELLHIWVESIQLTWCDYTMFSRHTLGAMETNRHSMVGAAMMKMLLHIFDEK